MKLTSAAMIVAFSCLTSPALAGWAEAEWGMSMEEVEGVIDGARLFDDSRADRLLADYEALGVPGQLGFNFQNGSLAEVKFAPDDEAECEGLEELVYSIYGEPNFVELIDNLTTMIWTDIDRANLVRFQSIKSPYRQCAVGYSPLPAPGVNGGI